MFPKLSLYSLSLSFMILQSRVLSIFCILAWQFILILRSLENLMAVNTFLCFMHFIHYHNYIYISLRCNITKTLHFVNIFHPDLIIYSYFTKPRKSDCSKRFPLFLFYLTNFKNDLNVHCLSCNVSKDLHFVNILHRDLTIYAYFVKPQTSDSGEHHLLFTRLMHFQNGPNVQPLPVISLKSCILPLSRIGAREIYAFLHRHLPSKHTPLLSLCLTHFQNGVYVHFLFVILLRKLRFVDILHPYLRV